MSFDDIIYLLLLFSSIGFGQIYRQIKDLNQKKWTGTGAGLFIIFVVSGGHIWHSFLTVFVNACIITFINKRQCHLMSFVFSFLYLFFFRSTAYFGIPYPPGHTNLVQMILTLKLVGLAFEVNSAYLVQKKKEEGVKTIEQQLEEESNDIKPNFVDIFHYSFNYVGVLTGPYYRYRTFVDHFNLPFSDVAPWSEETIKKLTYIPLYAVLFLWATYNWPLEYAFTEEFDTERSWLYRFWFIWPNFFIFRMRIYIGVVLSECVCTMACLGVYPEKTEPKPGLGPSKNFKELKEIADNPTRLAKEKYNFETIHNIHPYGADFCTTFRDGMKNWNICVQYWLAVYIYKRCPNKKFRTHITMFVSAIWHGVYTGYYICICSVALYLPIEDVYVKLFIKDNKGTSLKVWQWIIWFFKMGAFSYLSIAFHLLTLERVIHYYNSIYHAGAILGVILYVVGVQMMKARKIGEKRLGDKTEVPVQCTVTQLKRGDKEDVHEKSL